MNEIEELNKLKNRLEELEDYKSLTELERRILILHFEEPKLNQKELSDKLDCHRVTVCNFFNSQEFENLNREFGKLKKSSLIVGL